jgi:hypothetical protein
MLNKALLEQIDEMNLMCFISYLEMWNNNTWKYTYLF